MLLVSSPDVSSVSSAMWVEEAEQWFQNVYIPVPGNCEQNTYLVIASLNCSVSLASMPSASAPVNHVSVSWKWKPQNNAPLSGNWRLKSEFELWHYFFTLSAFSLFYNYLIFLWLNSYSQKKPLPHFTSLPLNVLYPWPSAGLAGVAWGPSAVYVLCYGRASSGTEGDVGLDSPFCEICFVVPPCPDALSSSRNTCHIHLLLNHGPLTEKSSWGKSLLCRDITTTQSCTCAP